MLRNLRYGASIFAVSAALVFGAAGFESAQAALPSSIQSQVDAALATGSDAAKVSAIAGIVTANIGDAVDIVAAAAVIDPDLADEIAGRVAALLPTQDAKNALVRSVCTALGDAHPDKALEICTQIVAAVPGSEGVLEDLIQTAAGGPFGDPTPLDPGEPVPPRVQNQTSDQIPFYKEVTQTTQSSFTTSPTNNVEEQREEFFDED